MNRPGVVSAIADAEDDHVAFVALDRFEVLDEDAVEAVAAEVVFELGMSNAEQVELLGDRVGLGDVEAITPSERLSSGLRCSMTRCATTCASRRLVAARPRS